MVRKHSLCSTAAVVFSPGQPLQFNTFPVCIELQPAAVCVQ